LQESLVNKCIQIFKTGHNQGEILVRIASILNLTKLEALSDMLPEMEKNKCGTKVFFIEYYSMIENLVKSFEKVNFVLTEIKNELQIRINEMPGFLLENGYKNLLSWVNSSKNKNLSLAFQMIKQLDQRRGLDSRTIFKDLYYYE